MKIVLIILGIFVGTICGKEWWENGNYYQIYPRSFRDSNGDGIGDLKGIEEKLQYLKDLGIVGVWLSPIFKSPMVDFGYDCSDYYSINPEYGTDEDFNNLIKKAKEIDIKIILDFVPNHTSDLHEWFQKSIDGIDPYTDYYIWHNGIWNATTGKYDPPTNWVSAFRYSAWEWNEVREQYYLHQFAVQQADLNFRNPAVVEEMKDIMRYWLGKGVSGFRIDAVPFLFEIEADGNGNYKDEPTVPSCPNPDDICHTEHIYTQNQPETVDMVYQWREVCDQYKTDNGGDVRLLLTEAYTSLETVMKYYGNGVRNGSQIPFNFQLLENTNTDSTAVDFVNVITSWLDRMPAGTYANWVLGNHDNKRIADRFGKNRVDLFNMLIQTLPGNAVTYYGEEIAMTDVYITWENTVDPQGCNTDPETFDTVSRDPERTPFQWDGSSNAGFSTGSETWLPVSEDYKNNNVLMQSRAPQSHLQIFKKLLKVRQEPSFQEGTLEMKTQGDNILVYKREKSGSEVYLVILNFGKSNTTINLQNLFGTVGNSVEIITTSLQSTFIDGQVVDSKTFNAQAEVGSVVVAVK